MNIPNFKTYYDNEQNILDMMVNGEIPIRSFSPIVMIIADYLTFELIFSGILNRKSKFIAPHFEGFDLFKFQKITL